ncbi:MAG: NUDIX hydrolase [Candidatus Yanofskybacteria bacterium]|nr:NUDIX hydrolase [Candidatus Yanofskybacteria bacterium]
MAELGDLPNNGVNIVLKNAQGEYLFVHNGTKWSLPGGGIKRGETSKQAVVRETNEESGLIIERPIMVADVQLVINWKHKVVLFTATSWDGIIDPLFKDEIKDARFFKPEDIHDNEDIYRAQRIFVKIYETAWLKLPLPVFAIATDPPIIEY